ncbi:alpha/beta-hydrolase [Neoconidiobolus thromboides FSU 785]|nr:alpha/beta-hydrolase [Neoconidiobolus thromboides FSU 785]
MSIPKACCTLPPVVSNYEPKGNKAKVEDFEYYIIGEEHKKTIFCCYDIFGFHNNTLQFVDLLSQAGYRVIVPDFFRGKPWSLDNFPPKNYQELKQWGFVDNNWENRVYKDLQVLIKHFNIDTEKDQTGIIGFCWGGKMVVEALKLSKPIFKAGAALHPAALTEQDFKEINYPFLFIPTKDESEIIPFFDQIKPSALTQSEKHEFTQTFHGFAAARGDFTNEENRKLTTDAINITATFFSKHLV